ncbi:helix-turn-helix transcriptional regulator [Pseudotabrizicola alkalilacus]|uniref:Helix-turn-helix transcriptional regulator n=1 Tax=Pseudotabrizicola alkalilacus TaxID=2305252 RepID=A0A411Z089_9RHOB|nr:helix-turn-helix transcriptional regulator [Pseudotabrizicola alkalilacus]
MIQDLTDRIYEAAFQPECWPQTLNDLATASGSLGGVLQVVRRGGVPRWIASPAVQTAFTAYAQAADFTSTHERAAHWVNRGQTFLRDIDVYDPAGLDADPSRKMLIGLGLGYQIGAILALPTGDTACFTFERPLCDGPHSPGARDILNGHLSHLARAGMMAARLGLEVARARVEAMTQIGLPAAVLRADGQIVAMNDTLRAMDDLILAVPQGKLALVAPRQNQRLSEALARVQTEAAASIPLRNGSDLRPVVVHLLPLRRTARALFPDGEVMLVVTPLAVSRMVPSVEALCGLFDLSPSEARLAAALSAGRTLAEAAAEVGITVKTARTYLERVFQKTVTHQQSELVALLKSAPWLPSPDTPANAPGI